MNSFEEKPKEGYGFIYKYTSPSGKSYIGQTRYSLKERAKTSSGLGYKNCVIFYRAIQKYGFENFKYTILGEFSIEELDDKERYFIEKENCTYPNGYNIKSGGAQIYEKGKNRKTKVNQYDLQGNYIKTYESLVAAAEDNDTTYQVISSVVRGIRTHHKNFIYTYENAPNPNPVEIINTHGRPTGQYDMDGNFIQSFPSANQAARFIEKGSAAGRNIRSVCEGKRKSAYGFIWKYLD